VAETKPVIPLKRSQFVCPKCPGQDGQSAFFFFAALEQMRQNDTGEYVADCPECGVECAELWYMANVRNWQGKQAGPVTEAGKNKVRGNAFRTGSSYFSGAIPKTLPPAKPGKYPECDDCQDLDECTQSVADAMGTCRSIFCHRRTEIYTKYREAHISGDPESLRLTAAEVHARMHMVLNSCFKAIFDNGVFIESLIVSDGRVVKMKDYKGNDVNLLEKKINPAINESIKILEKMGFSLADWTLTPKSKEAKAALEGYLVGRATEKGQTMDEFLAKHNADMKAFHSALARGNELVKNDPMLIEALQEEKEPGA